MALPPKRKKERRKGGGNWRSPGHRALVRTRECSVPGCRQGPVETAHVRLGTDGGMGLKPSASPATIIVGMASAATPSDQS